MRAVGSTGALASITALGARPGSGAVFGWKSREMLGRALGNLIKNGIQHAQDGLPVRVSARAEPSRVVVLVEDGGARVGGEFEEKVFTAEGQVSAKGQVGARYSRGIGLYAARLAAGASGAEVRAVAPPSGGGNAFELSIGR